MQSIFERYETKYLITREQGAALLTALTERMEPDRFGNYLVQNLYYDTDDWAVIRASIEKPVYKEKMRLRCYGVPTDESDFFLELKKKYKGVVYKRRIVIPGRALSAQSAWRFTAEEPAQISRELDFYIKANAVSEKIYISYKRTAFAGKEDKGLRITFDTDIRFRLDRLDCYHPGEGVAILSPDQVLMEVKTLGGMPLWLAHALCENAIFPTSFSKYGTCYTGYIAGRSFVAGAHGEVGIGA